MFELHLTITASPRVQKNNLEIRKRISKSGKVQRWVGHSDNFKAYREAASREMYDQYVAQGFSTPIDFQIEVDMVCYLSGPEADSDNLIAASLDAMMGLKVKGAPKGFKVCKILKDDILAKRVIVEKITKEDGYEGKPRTEITIRKYERRETGRHSYRGYGNPVQVNGTSGV